MRQVQAVLGRLRGLTQRHRRLVAGILAALAVGVAVDALAPPPTPGVAVAALSRDVAAGTVLSAADLTTVRLPVGTVPEGVAAPGQVVGRTLASAAHRREVITDARLLGSGVLTGLDPDQVAMAVRLAEPGALALLSPGAQVRVLAGPAADGFDPTTGQGAALTGTSTVLAVPGAPASSGGLGGSGLGGSGLGGSGLGGSATAEPVVVLAVDPQEALALAEAAGRRYLSLALLP